MLEEALEHLVKGIVDHPDEVQVASRTLRRGRVLEVRVHPEDLGKVIGRNGRTARSLRTVVGALGGKGIRVDLVDADEVR
ncbi:MULTISPECIES: RNA-binding protein [Streptomyces]|uniref:RNA-binding protein KhpA n=4 Tax=Streptomyces TaxID=1883 RepID=A0A5N6A0I5_9ACTN|nr:MULTISPECIES: RNA-binding protein [Streptomyces]KAB8161563.1 RNA-binding protein [Streptomyces mimosae]KAB8173500.1 RNA-binding protein [Streptomyces sp. 3MP-14]MDT0269341.1 RNA-binding protein [Streptomyces sp. DSM 44915]MDT0341146.1 RNA-binding protein [Streptomyces sp. DSM 44938]RMI40316.1 RNA-binding protein [Streptomyces triticirhizae]